MRLLVVDDDPSVREALALLLDLNGFDVDVACDGREAIRRMALASPDAVILDVLMPGLRALLRRTGWEGDDATLRFDDLELDPVLHEVRRGGRLLELTRTEFLLLELLMNHPRQVLTRETIFERVWGYDFGPSSNSLEVYVGYLRRKTEAGGEPRLLHTVRGVGYVLRTAPR